jgi:hypothetical protein
MMKGLFIWTVVSHGAVLEKLPDMDADGQESARLTLDRKVSRELVEISYSGVCGGTLVRFIQPHGLEMVRLGTGESQARDGNGHTSRFASSSLILEVRLLGVSNCADWSCLTFDRPCHRYAEFAPQSPVFLLCTGGACVAHEQSSQGFESCTNPRPAAPVPTFIRRLVDLSYAALPDSARCARCESPEHFLTIRRPAGVSLS